MDLLDRNFYSYSNGTGQCLALGIMEERGGTSNTASRSSDHLSAGVDSKIFSISVPGQGGLGRSSNF